MKVNFKELEEELRALFADRSYTCDSCGAEVFNYPKQRLCEKCNESLSRNNSKTCPKCGRKLVSEGVCLTCKKSLPLFKKGISPLVYEGEVSELVNRLKNGQRYLAWLLGEEIAERLKTDEEFSTDLLVVGVPMTQSKRCERGYNQAEELAKVISKRLGLECDLEVLEKRKDTIGQKHLNYKERKKNLEGSIFVHKRVKVRDRRILLVDDILTTGATGNECSRVLLSAGAKEVIFVTVASLKENK